MARIGRTGGMPASTHAQLVFRRAEYEDRSSLTSDRDGILNHRTPASECRGRDALHELMSKYDIIPSIEQLRQRDAVRLLEARYGHDATTRGLRDATESLRKRLADGPVDMNDSETVAHQIEEQLEPRLQMSLSPSLRPLINGTGVIVHTNLGRAPLATQAVERIAAVAGYSNLEYDLERGTRGLRTTHAASLLKRLTGAQDATVANNNAAAVLLTLTALAEGREVVISRGELVEIGGGFRIPDVLRQSGARLREVGTTNRTRPADYAAAINDRTALLLRVHPSNFRMQGYAARPSLEAVTDIGHRFNVPVVEDLGSGNLLDRLVPSATLREPTVRSSVAAGVTVCCFSGDKLLGGPQAGIIVGRHDELERIRRHPLMRALRVDKLAYAALEATLLEHATGRADVTVPVARMIAATVESLETRAGRIVDQLVASPELSVRIQAGQSAVGGGTTPGVTIPSRLLHVQLEGYTPDGLEALLRRSTPPVIGRIEHDHVLVDLRTVQPDEDDALVAVLTRLAGSASDSG